MSKHLIYEFWRSDFPTEVVLNELKNLGIPYKTKIVHKLREGSMKDEWLKVYVSDTSIIKWLIRYIEETIAKM